MAQLTARLPLIEVSDEGQTYVATIILGHAQPGAEFGDEVQVVTPTGTMGTQYVAATDTAPVTEIVDEVLQLFGYATSRDLVAALERAHGTGLPANVTVTIYTLYDEPVESADTSDDWHIYDVVGE